LFSGKSAFQTRFPDQNSTNLTLKLTQPKFNFTYHIAQFDMFEIDMGRITIALIAIQFSFFLFTIKCKSVRLLLVRTRACTHLSILVMKLTFT